MIVKVCGLRQPQNILDIVDVGVDWIGFNFYPLSPRYMQTPPQELRNIDNATKVGVFVNADLEYILKMKETYSLDFAQLHGDETLEVCKEINQFIPIIKVFRIHDQFDFSTVSDYAFAAYYLFDTDSKAYGGSGHKFDWSLVFNAMVNRPYLIGGGITPQDIKAFAKMKQTGFVGVDINSKFEIEPGLKDVQVVQNAIWELKST
jgi:phosphoribosylanthranilate isomerase